MPPPIAAPPVAAARILLLRVLLSLSLLSINAITAPKPAPAAAPIAVDVVLFSPV